MARGLQDFELTALVDSGRPSRIHAFGGTFRYPIRPLLGSGHARTSSLHRVGLAPRLAERDIRIQAVRLDSGDLAADAFRVRQILDDGGLGEVKIVASGGLDEYEVRDILATGAPIDSFGIGSRLDTSADAPYLDCAYKLMEYAGTPRRKKSESKATWPGRKQVVRRYDEAGQMAEDELIVEHEISDGEPLLEQVMDGGKPVIPRPTLEQARQRLQGQLQRLPSALAALDADASYPVEVSPAVRDLARLADDLIARQFEPRNGS